MFLIRCCTSSCWQGCNNIWGSLVCLVGAVIIIVGPVGCYCVQKHSLTSHTYPVAQVVKSNIGSDVVHVKTVNGRNYSFRVDPQRQSSFYLANTVANKKTNWRSYAKLTVYKYLDLETHFGSSRNAYKLTNYHHVNPSVINY